MPPKTPEASSTTAAAVCFTSLTILQKAKANEKKPATPATAKKATTPRKPKEVVEMKQLVAAGPTQINVSYENALQSKVGECRPVAVRVVEVNDSADRRQDRQVHSYTQA